MKDEIRYGCGSGVFFIKDCIFFEACKSHDIAYLKAIGDRKTIDKKLLNDMLEIANGRKKYIVLAYLFYRIVRIVWGYFYNENKKKENI